MVKIQERMGSYTQEAKQDVKRPGQKIESHTVDESTMRCWIMEQLASADPKLPAWAGHTAGAKCQPWKMKGVDGRGARTRK